MGEVPLYPSDSPPHAIKRKVGYGMQSQTSSGNPSANQGIENGGLADNAAPNLPTKMTTRLDNSSNSKESL